MIKCLVCNRQTRRGEPTGSLITSVYKDSYGEEKGKRIISSKKSCMKCSGEIIRRPSKTRRIPKQLRGKK